MKTSDQISKKMRGIIRLFKASPIKNSVLQNHVKEKFGKELSLLLDYRTRWSSTEIMLARFISLHESIVLALADINSTEQIDDDEITLLKDVMNALEPLKLAVKELSKRDSNLLASEGVLLFTLNELKTQDTAIANQLYTALKIRVSQRRNTELVSVLKYLKNKELTSTELPMLSKKNVHKTIVDLITKYFPAHLVEQVSVSPSPGSSAAAVANDELTDTIDSRLKSAIQATLKNPEERAPDLKKIVRHELTQFENTNVLGPFLNKILTALMTVQPTSTESERVFSSSANFCTKKRTRLSDKSLNCLCFLKSFFLKKE